MSACRKLSIIYAFLKPLLNLYTCLKKTGKRIGKIRRALLRLQTQKVRELRSLTLIP